MFEKVLVPYDFSEDSRFAVNCLKKISQLQTLFLLHVVYNKYPSTALDIISPGTDYARLKLEEVQRSLDMPGKSIVTRVVEITGGQISDSIIGMAAREGISLICMGRRGRGIIETLILGSVASDVLRYGKTDLLLVHSPADNEDPAHDSACPDLFSNVLICTDFSEPEIGRICHDQLPEVHQVILFHSVTRGESQEEIQSAVDAARTRLEKIRQNCTHVQIPVQIQVVVGSAGEEIVAYAKREHVSLIILKSTGRRSLLTDLLGSTTAYVARNARQPVLVLKRYS